MSQEDAQAKADERARDALRWILDGSKLARREMKEAYGGESGLPIREEIISRHGDVVITRNSYGALCLNTPNVMFVDVDFDDRPRFEVNCLISWLLIACAVAYGFWQISAVKAFIFVAASFLIARGLCSLMNAIHRQLVQKPAEAALQRIESFATAHPNWHLGCTKHLQAIGCW